MDKHLIAYYIGITIVFGSHLAMIPKFPHMAAHAVFNLSAATMIAYYFLNKEGKITW